MAYRAFKYRLYPTATQDSQLCQQLETLRRVFNDALQLSKDVYAATGKSPARGYLFKVIGLSRNAQLDDLKNGLPGPKWLTQVSAVSVRDTCARVETAFKNFFDRIRKGVAKGKLGFPRFKGRGRLRSIPFENTYPAGCVIRRADGTLAGEVSRTGRTRGVRNIPRAKSGYRLDVFGVGRVKVVVHRDVQGTIKTVCVRRDVDGKWYVVLVCDVGEVSVEKKDGPAVGIDLGLESFLTTSDGEHVVNPRFLKSNLKKLRVLQRSASRKVEVAKKAKRKFRECKNLQKSFREVARLHVHVRNQRKEHHHRVSRSLVDRYATVCVENLNVQGMVRNDKLSRAISDAGWSAFLDTLKQHAVKRGVSVVEVDARGTSQTCPRCDGEVPKKLKDRVHDCPHCAYRTHRDHAAAQNILKRGAGSNGMGHIPPCVKSGVTRICKGTPTTVRSSSPRGAGGSSAGEKPPAGTDPPAITMTGRLLVMSLLS